MPMWADVLQHVNNLGDCTISFHAAQCKIVYLGEDAHTKV